MHRKQTDGKKIPAKAAVKRLAAGGLSVLVAAASANGGLAVPVLAEDNHEILREETVPVSDAADPEDSGELVTEEAPEGRDSAGESQQPAVTEQPEITEIPQEQEENEEEETREEVRSIPAASDAAEPQVVQAAPEAEPEIQAEVQVSTPLLITEIVADTHQADQTTASGTDAFEYVELYNASDRTVSLDSYLIQNLNGSTVTDWEIPAGTLLEAGKSLAVWIRNGESDALEEGDFRSYYGIDDNVQVVKTTESVNGFSNSGERSIRVIVRATGQTVTQITYNDGAEKAQTKKGITFGYTEGQTQQPTLAYNGEPTPGTAQQEQLPEGLYTVTEVSGASVSASGEEQASPGASYKITASTDLPGLILNAVVTVTTEAGSSQYPMEYKEGTFTASIPADAFAGAGSFTYHVEMNNGVNTAVSGETSVTVSQEPSRAEFPAPLLLTEIVPNTANEGGSDAFEYFEVYNAGDQAVNLDQYGFWYDNGSSVKQWILEDRGLVLEAHETLVVWIRNEANIAAGFTVENFNANYGTSYEQGVNFTSVQSDGFSNSGTRRISIRAASGTELSTVEYTAGDSSNGKLDEGESICFSYSGEEVSVTYDHEETPGALDGDQSIQGQYTFPAVAEAPSVEADAPAVVHAGDSWTVTMSGTSLTEGILSAELRLYQEGAEEASAALPMTYAEGVLQASLTYEELKAAGGEKFQYEITVSDGVNTAFSPRKSAVLKSDEGTVDRSQAPALTITELMPDSSNVNGADAYEFIELYNNSNRDIDLKDYKLYYNYPDNGDNSDVVWWETSESRILKAGDTLVFWIKNGGNDALTREDFNAKFGTDLDEAHLVEISCGGMANSGARGVKIASNVKDVSDYVTYNMNGADNTSADRSITFQNQYTDGAFSSAMTSDEEAPTPGTVKVSQKPYYAAELPETAAAPVLTDQTPETFSDSSSLIFQVEAVSRDTAVKTVRLYVRDSHSDTYEMYNLLRSLGDVFTREIPGVDLTGKQYYEYYFEVSNGYETVSTEPKQVKNENAPEEGDQLNVEEGQFLSGTQSIIGTGGSLKIDGEEVSGQAVSSINGDARIAFDASQTDVFFKNAVAIGEDVLGVFNEGTYDAWRTYAYDVDEHYFDPETRQITIAFHAGNKANNLEHDIENNDDFVLKNIRLVLPDGVSLRPVAYGAVNGIGAIPHTEENWHPDQPYDMGEVSPETEISMGDGTTKVEILYVTFQLEESSFNALRVDLDTRELEDGPHTIASGAASVQVMVDNTAPEITTNLAEGETYRDVEILARASDALSREVELTAALDGETIELPYALEAEVMEAGEHTLTLTAVDQAGNTAEKTVTFIIPEENASADVDQPEDTVHGNPTLSVNVVDPTEDTMTVTFKKGEKYQLGDENITGSQGVSDASGTEAQVFSKESGDGFPYQVFDVKISGDPGEDSAIRVDWEGTSNSEKTFMYVYNLSTGAWDPVEAEQTLEGTAMSLSGVVELAEHLNGDTVRIMIQNGEGYTPPQYAPGEASDSATYNEKDTPRENYDFTFVVESDTQYYNEDYEGNPSQDVDGLYQYQLDIHNWILANRERMNIQYLFHDGDIIDDEPLIPEWENADAAYQMLDEAGLPYGVLAGNHDVGHLSGDYSNFSKYFGEWRYSGNPWYGGSYKDNRGHYDLITVGGIDFIMVYMGWGIGNEEIEWMNQVLAQYPERKAILNFHEYLLASGGMGEEPQRVYDEVVAQNPNVCMVFSGHYHNAQTRVDSFDDDGDGIAERKVYQMLFDYQGLAQGGMGYIRLMHFDMANQQILFRTYSPSLDDYDAKDETDIGDVAGINGEEEFAVSFADLGIVPETKTLETAGLTVNVYGNETIGTVENVASGTTASYTWENAPEGTVGWYAEVTDANGGLTRTDVNYLNIEKAGYEPVITLPDGSANQVEEGADFDPLAGVTAKDYQGNDLTDKITVVGTVDTSVPGLYDLVYTVSDEKGNTAAAERTVQVLEADDSGDEDHQGGTGGGSQTGGTGGQSGSADPNGSGSGSGQKPGGSHQGTSPDTGDPLGTQMPLYGAGILAGMAGIVLALRKKASGVFRRNK